MYNDGYKQLWDKILRRMGEKGLSQTQLCARAHVSRSTLRKIRTGQMDPSVDVLNRLARALQVPFEELLNDMYNALLAKRVAVSFRDDKHFVFPFNDYDPASLRVLSPDTLVVRAGHRFEKEWEIQNVGSLTWCGFRMIAMNEPPSLVAADVRIYMDLVRPGETVRRTMRFTAPSEPGIYYSSWQIFNEGEYLVFTQEVGFTCRVLGRDEEEPSDETFHSAPIMW